MTAIEHYHDWLRDAHAMEKQAESMLSKMSGRLEHYPALNSVWRNIWKKLSIS